MTPRPTPETDLEEAKQTQRHAGWMVKTDFARTLERERDAARADADRMAALLDEPMRIGGMDWPPHGWPEAARSALDAHEALKA